MTHLIPKKYSRLRIIGATSAIGAQDHACEGGPVAFHHAQAWHEVKHHPLVGGAHVSIAHC